MGLRGGQWVFPFDAPVPPWPPPRHGCGDPPAGAVCLTCLPLLLGCRWLRGDLSLPLFPRSPWGFPSAWCSGRVATTLSLLRLLPGGWRLFSPRPSVAEGSRIAVVGSPLPVGIPNGPVLWPCGHHLIIPAPPSLGVASPLSPSGVRLFSWTLHVGPRAPNPPTYSLLLLDPRPCSGPRFSHVVVAVFPWSGGFPHPPRFPYLPVC